MWEGFDALLIFLSIKLDITTPFTDRLASRQSPSCTGAMFSGVPVISRSPSPSVTPASCSKNFIYSPILKIILPVLSY